MRKRNLKVTSLMLITVMLLNFLPASATAVSDADAQTTPGVSTVPNPDYVEPGSVRELESRREENVKHFLLPDNTVQAVVYADAVHRKDADGNWQDISNDLSLTEYKGVKFYTTADERVVFAEKFAPNAQLWQLSENGYTVAMGVVSNHLSADATVIGQTTVTNAPVQRNAATTWHSVEEARVVDNTASIVYSNIKANTDLEYVMVGNDIKENIVVKTRSNSYTYQFQLTLTGLTAVLNEDGSISLTDSATGQQQYIIPAPYMIDAAGEYSNEVTYALNQAGEGQYTLTVTADSTWINAEDREFPVKIDPTVKNISYMDTYIDPAHPTTSYAHNEDLWLGDDCIVYFKAGLPMLPAGAEIVSASLVVRYYYQAHVTTGSLRGKAYMVTQDWSDGTLTWNTALQMDNFGLWPTTPSYQDFSGSVGAYENTPGTATFNIMHAVNFWKTGTPNYGIALRYYNGTNSSVLIKSFESAAQYRPYYTFTYTEQRLIDGVYRLQNVGTNLYLEVRNGGYTAGTPVQQNFLTDAQNLRSQLFKITFLETVDSNNYYSIRPMTNSGMGLSAPLTGSTRYVTIDTMSTSEVYADINAEQRWIISQSGYQYTLKNGNDTQGRYLASALSVDGAMVETLDGDSDYTKWSLTRYDVQIEEVVFPSYMTHIMRGETYYCDAFLCSSAIGRNGPVTYRIPNADNSIATINFSTGQLEALSAGDIIIRCTYSGAQKSWDFPVTIEFDEGYVYTLNHFTSNTLAKPTNADGNASIVAGAYDYNKPSMMWRFIYAGAGYYKIRNEQTGYYLTAPENSNNNAVIQQTLATYDTDYELWKFIPTSSGRYKLQSKNQYLREATAPLYITVLSGNVVQSTATTANEWSIKPITMRVEVLYDDAFVQRFGENSYREILSSIYNEDTSVGSFAWFFKEKFGICVKVSISSKDDYSYPDIANCEHKNSINTICHDCKNVSDQTLEEEHNLGLHHKDEDSFFDTLDEVLLQNSEKIKILHTGHIACALGDTGDHIDGYAMGRGDTGMDSAVIYTAAIPNDENFLERMKCVAAHETIHVLGVYNHCHPNRCIMGDHVDVMETMPLCSECEEMVNNNKIKLYGHS